MSESKLVAELEWLIAFAKTISSVKGEDRKDRLLSMGPHTLGRKAIKTLMIREKKAFRQFMEKAKNSKACS
jgi:hypothetical protein